MFQIFQYRLLEISIEFWGKDLSPVIMIMIPSNSTVLPSFIIRNIRNYPFFFSFPVGMNLVAPQSD